MKHRVTSVDVAREAKVSQSLVSLALNKKTQNRVKPETRELIYNTAQRLGYRMNMNARNMKVNKANAIGLISAWDMNAYVFAPVVRGVKDACFDKNYALTMCSADKDSRGIYDFKEYYLQNRIDGVVVISYVGFEKEKLFNELKESGIPFTCIIGCVGMDGISGVDEDFYKSGIAAAEHLSEKGYRNLIYIMKAAENELNYAERERYLGCRDSAQRLGIEFHPYQGFIGCSDKHSYEEAAHKLLSHTRKMDSCAIVSTSFECYSILGAAIKDRVSVPEEIGIISLDNEKYNAYLTPPLTSVKQPLERMGKEAAELLIDKLDGKEMTDCVKKPESELIIRAST